MTVPISNKLQQYMKQNRFVSEFNAVNKSLFQDRPSFKELQKKSNLVGCEIGVQFGLNTYNIISELDIKRLYLIDIYLNEDVIIEKFAHELLEPFVDKIVWIKEFSDEACNQIHEPLDFVYIDGDHRTEQCMKDIDNYYPILKMGGLLSGHDYHKDWVKTAVKAYFSNVNNKNWDWWIIKESESLCQKK